MGAIGKLGRQLKRDGIQIVTLESTSDYWRIWFFVLETCGQARPRAAPITGEHASAQLNTGASCTSSSDAMARWTARRGVNVTKIREAKRDKTFIGPATKHFLDIEVDSGPWKANPAAVR